MEIEKHLYSQVQKILDEDPPARQEIIVQMGSRAPRDAKVLAAIMDGIHHARLATSAREVLPPGSVKPASNNSLVLAPAEGNRGETLGGQALRFAATLALKQLGLEALMPLLDSSFVKSAINDVAEAVAKRSKTAKGGKAAALVPVPIWASSSAVLTVPRDKLMVLPAEVAGIQDIYPNRRLSVPPLVSAADLPAEVSDNTTCSWGLVATGALAAWGAYGAKGAGVLVGLLDTGVDATHPDLAGKIQHWVEMDAKGHEVPGSTPHDSGEHGTHCAGTICGGRESGRYIGMAPEAKLAVALVLNGRSGTDSQILKGIQ